MKPYFIFAAMSALWREEREGFSSPRKVSLFSLRQRFDRIELNSSIILENK